LDNRDFGTTIDAAQDRPSVRAGEENAAPYASLRDLDTGPPLRACIEHASAERISGWAIDTRAPTRCVDVRLNLHGRPLVRRVAGIPRNDIAVPVGQSVGPDLHHCGFDLVLADHEVAERVMEILGWTYLVASEEGQSPTDIRIKLTLDVLSGRGDSGGFDGSELQLQLPESFEMERPLSDWLEFFDLDEEGLRMHSSMRQSALRPSDPDRKPEPRVIAFYLPQFHTTPENDEWWGPGFTEWTGVATARKQFAAHQAPNVPADLGFYDLTSIQTRTRQAELARRYGIFGFAYYFYWFSGRRLLERPLELMLSDGAPDMPFCLCWANEPWSRRWDGSEAELLIPQHHDASDDVAILDDLVPYFEDSRYIRVDDRPLLLVYRMSLMDDPATFVSNLRREIRRRGFEDVYLCNVMSFGDSDPRVFGCDGGVEFPPHNFRARGVPDDAAIGLGNDFEGQLFDYSSVVEYALLDSPRPYKWYPGCMPRWDNTARRGAQGSVYVGSSPELFEVWLRHACSQTCELNPEAPLVFVNSWNEWGEGAHLEPDRATGRSYLEAVRRVVSADSRHRFSRRDAQTGTRVDTAVDDSIRALASENELLRRRLRETRGLLRPVAFFEGIPEPLVDLDVAPGARAYIEVVNGRGLLTRYTVRRPHGLQLSGWLTGRPDNLSQGEEVAYVRLKAITGEHRYYGLLTERTSRPDVARELALPSASGLGLGFEGHLSLDAVERGTYSVSLIEVVQGRAFCAETDVKLLVL
jgi:hypothetical protein